MPRAVVAAAVLSLTTAPFLANPAGAGPDGAALYAEHCASCHGAALEGEPDWRSRKPNGRLPAPPHDETGHTWHHPDETLFVLTKHGPKHLAGPDYETDMPAFAGILDDDGIEAVLDYIKSRWPAEIRQRQARINQSYEAGKPRQ